MFNSKPNKMKSQEIFNQFKELKSKMQKDALKNDNLTLFNELSDLTLLMIDLKTEYFKEGLNKGIEIVKKSYNL